jgi:signal transduction histidine kinase
LQKVSKPQSVKSITSPEDMERLFNELIIDNSRSMVSIINRNYVYEKVNKPFTEAHRGKIKKFTGKSLSDVWGIEAFENVIKEKIDLCFTGKRVMYEASFNTPGKGDRNYEVIFRPVKNKSGEVTHLMAETYDVTELRKSESKSSELEAVFRERELFFEDRLQHARNLEMIGVMAGGIAHDFNNILATISGYTEMLRDDLSENQQDHDKADKILAAVSKARSLVNQILAFSGQLSQEKVNVDVNEVLDDAYHFMKTSIPTSVNVIMDHGDFTETLFADPIQLFRIFINLFTNALQAMEGKKGRLTISTSLTNGEEVSEKSGRKNPAPKYVAISFRDTGVGMDKNVMARIFEPFYTTKEIGKGTGLGLSVVYGIVTEMEGEILVNSEINKGSVFKIYLPVRQRHQADADRSVQK